MVYIRGKKNNMETIICSAIHIKDDNQHTDQPSNIKSGFVISGRRHNNCYATISALYGDLDKYLAIIEHSDSDQGFITSLNRYVDRKEAFVIADKAKQLLYPKLYYPSEPNILTSECLFPTDWENFTY